MKYSNDKKIYNTVVIGSGPALIAAVSSLLKKRKEQFSFDACIDSHQNTSKISFCYFLFKSRRIK